MPAYILMAALTAHIPPQFLTQALDDDGDGAADPAAFDLVVAAAQQEIDGLLGQRYAVPFANPIPAVVANAALVLVCEAIYGRRGVTEEKNPFTARAKGVRAQLTSIAKGDMPLTPEVQRAKPSASAITEPAKTSSARGRSAI